MNTNIEVLRELDELVEAARLLGVTQAKRGFDCYTDEDRRFERAMYESIDKHRAALLDWEAKQPAPQQPAAGDGAKETDLWRCTVCGRVGTVGRCCGEETRERANMGSLQAEIEKLRAEVEQLAASEKTCRRIANEKTLEAMELRQQLTAAKAEIETLREALKYADNELDWLDEDMDTCDHSVGVCTCDYWNMRRKMKAALEKGNSND